MAVEFINPITGKKESVEKPDYGICASVIQCPYANNFPFCPYSSGQCPFFKNNF